jgi:hypothetical protein
MEGPEEAGAEVPVEVVEEEGENKAFGAVDGVGAR